ncbi:phage protein Gp37 [Nitrosovibrio sp. Nv4]|uniref:phage protein Gp37 n=1 Tax=Nitrosovibrio sp. Nv4 TaxID=1945880 RepID=UPI000BD2B7E4|nr:phage protein Gp37 [Nitrosovibrio sp. Nv4]SOD42328.1 Mu-like prophage protein gp37 [Nitrosovibrio sp. Nv4]
MLAEAENELIILIKASPLGAKLREVASLPDLSGESLVKKFGIAAPAVYLAAGSLRVSDRSAQLRFGAACVARNSRGHDAARQGDGAIGPIGLYEMLETVSGLLDGASAGSSSWKVTAIDFITDETLYKAGVYAGVVQIETYGTVDLPAPVDEATLSPFITFHSDIDIPPHEAGAEHEKWLQEPPDQTASKPDAEDQVGLGE